MESILTASETHAFKAFLSQINYDSTLVDSLVASAEWSSIDTIPVPHAAPGKEALAKATKDLMSLQAPQPPPQPQTTIAPSSTLRSSLDYSSATAETPLFRQALRLTTAPSRSPQLISSFQGWHDALRGRSGRSSSSASLPCAESSSSQSLLGDASPRSPSSPGVQPASASANKRASSAVDGEDGDNSTSPGPSKTKRARASSSAPGKPALLTPSQKKANHIQSEQKRRANIRRGYEALCETVPALVEAIRAEEAATASTSTASSSSCAGGKDTNKKRRGRSAKGAAAAAAASADDGGDKTDGRAGPRSENIVLGKTVEHIHDLLNTRDALLARLEHARSLLPPGYPGVLPPGGTLPVWEREWTGGEDPDADDAPSDDEGA